MSGKESYELRATSYELRATSYELRWLDWEGLESSQDFIISTKPL